MSRFLRLIAVLLLVALSFPAAAYMLDQFQELPGNGSTSVYWNRKLAQTFTPGLTEVLAFVEFGVSDIHTPGDLDVSITKTVAGVPSLAPADVLATVVVPEASIAPGWNRVDFEQENVTLTEGDLYSVLLEQGESDTWVRFRWEDDPDSYPDGGLWNYSLVIQTWKWSEGAGPYSDPSDSQFRTYMVPEPGLLCLLGLGAAGILRRRR